MTCDLYVSVQRLFGVEVTIKCNISRAWGVSALDPLGTYHPRPPRPQQYSAMAVGIIKTIHKNFLMQ